MKLMYVDDKQGSRSRIISLTDETIYEFSADEVTIGRAPESGIILPYETVSRAHAKLRRHRPGLSITDLGSSNGTYVGNVKIMKETGVLPYEVFALGYGQDPCYIMALDDANGRGHINLKDIDTGKEVRVDDNAPVEFSKPLRIAYFRDDGTVDLYQSGKPLLDIGRDSKNGICINAPGVSRTHAQLTLTGSGYTVYDKGSLNRTFVDDREVPRNSSLGAYAHSVISLGEGPKAPKLLLLRPGI
ncbi:MAG TPA: FHA domain-containing protein [archaeon]|nr:FHA domain-containing protein [archaeon]